MINVQNIRKSYDDREVLKGLSLYIPRNKCTVILGRSGVGKSVLLRLISGLETPDSGDIFIDGVPLFASSPSEKEDLLANVGMLFQNGALFDSMTVGENVAFSLTHNPLLKNKVPPLELAKIIKDSLAEVGLEGYENKCPQDLSGGQRKRAALARLMVYRPSILLFDEPTSGLDPITAMQIYLLIAETQKELQATAIVVTHDITVALAVGDYFAFHHEGKIVASGDKQTFFQDQHPVLRHFLSCSQPTKEFL